MTTDRIRRRFAWLAAMALFLAPSPTVQAEENRSAVDRPSEAAEEHVQSDVRDAVNQREEAILEEARAALDETRAALTALDAADEQRALDSLARATGKLEILLAREPTLALAPIDVDLVTHDVYATVDSVRAIRKRASDLLDDGRVQEARELLAGLASEIVISVTNMPLATYPDAIKTISPMIDRGEIDQAKQALRAVMNTLVVTQHVISLPVLRARHQLAEAETLLGEPGASADDAGSGESRSERIDALIQGARHQLEMAEVLGYGRPADHETFRKQIAELERKIGGDQETGGVFARLQESLRRFQTSFLQ